MPTHGCAPAITTSPSMSSQSIDGRLFHGCSVELVDQKEHSHGQKRLYPVSMRIYFDPTLRLALIRLRATIDIEINGETQSTLFYLDIHPPLVESLRHDLDATNSCLDFQLSPPDAVHLIAPQSIPINGIYSRTPERLEALRFVTQQSAIRVILPVHAVDRRLLDHFCSEISVQGSGSIRSHPASSNLHALYMGKGGRIVHADECLHSPAVLSSPSRPPPEYTLTEDNVRIDARLPPSSLFARPSSSRKRPRVSSPSSSASVSDIYRNTVLGSGCVEKEKHVAVAEFLRRFEETRNGGLEEIMGEIEKRNREALENSRKLAALIEDAIVQQAALKELVDSAQKASVAQPSPEVVGDKAATATEVHSASRASQVNTAFPSSPASAGSPDKASTTSTTSITSAVPDTIQTYISEQMEQLREDMRRQYVTQEDMENSMYQAVENQVERTLCFYVEECEMQEAIKDAIDIAMAEIREKVLKVWDD